MTVEIPSQLEAALNAEAHARGISTTTYVCEVLVRDLKQDEQNKELPPFETGYGMWKKYGVSISAEEIHENRADMFRNFGESF